MKIEWFISDGGDVHDSYSINRDRANVVYKHMVSRAKSRTTPYDNISQCVLYLFEGFEFAGIGEVLYAYSLFYHNKDAILNASITPNARTEAAKPYGVTDLGNGKVGISVNDPDFGDFLKDVIKRAGLNKPDDKSGFDDE